jgi:small subunit ribosomal protein S3
LKLVNKFILSLIFKGVIFVGQKTHPTGFRLGITKKHNSSWFSKFKNYSDLLQEDYKIRSEFLNFLNFKKVKNSNISKIVIIKNFKFNTIFLEVHAAFPGIIVGKSGQIFLDNFNKFFEKFLKTGKKIKLSFIQIADPYMESVLIADFIAQQLEKRVQFKRAVKKAISFARSKGRAEGIKVQVSGRLNGAEIARSEWLREGRVPLQTLRADIDYSSKTAQTIYGIIGIKIWLFKGELY